MSNRSAAAAPLTPMHSDAGSSIIVPGSASPPSPPPSKNRAVNVRDSLRYFIAGNIAGMTGVIVGQPFDTLKVRMQTQELVAIAQAQGRNYSANAIAPRMVQPPALIVDTPLFTQSSGVPRSRMTLGAARSFAAPSYFAPPVFSIGGGVGSMRGRGTLAAQSFSSTFVSGPRPTTSSLNLQGPMGMGSVAATAVAAVAAAPSSVVGAGANAATAGAMPVAAPLFTSPLACFLATVRGSGVRGLYRGMSSPLLLVGVQKSVAFGVFGTVCQHLQGSKHLPTLSETCIAGVAGGVANSLILTPIDQMKIAMQIQSYGNPAAAGTAAASAASGEVLHMGSAKQPSMLATAGTILREQGLFRGVYGNFRATLLREIPMYSIYYTLYGYLSRTFLVDPLNRSRFQPPPATTHTARAHSTEAAALLNASPLSSSPTPGRFWPLSSPHQELVTKLLMGGLTGVGCWASCYPLDTLKSHMVAQTAQNVPVGQRRNIRGMARHIYETGGVRPFYNGLTPALLRAFPVHAVVFFTFAYVSEMIEKHDAF